ncbi:hypothetical protein [Streptomyces sp. NRRL S-920]|nr:hypothetical protein [Streptomyces sp. NRRL S-920]
MKRLIHTVLHFWIECPLCSEQVSSEADLSGPPDRAVTSCPSWR